MTANTRGALLMISAMCAFTFNDAFMKALFGVLPLSQAVFLRGCLTTAAMLALAAWLGQMRLSVPRRDRMLIAMRTSMEVATAYFFLNALANIPLANASAILQALPLTVTLAGAVFLRQAIGWRRMAAILVGLCGVLLIVRPGLDGFTIYSLYALAAVVCITARDVFSRQIAAEVPSLMIALNNAIWVTIAFGVASIWADWAPVSGTSWLILIAAAGTIIVAYFCAVAAMRTGEIAVVQPYRYTSLIAAILVGLVLFGEVPDGLTLLGAAIVAATGLYTFLREQRLAAGQRS
ncbi:MAG: DMT family transporter [Pseudomonadota bacterium]